MSQYLVYDGRAALQLSSQAEVPSPEVDADLRNVEFKLNLAALIDDFEQELKVPEEITLVVVWDDALSTEITDYQVVDIEHTDDADRGFHRVTKALHCKRRARMIQMLVLSELTASGELLDELAGEEDEGVSTS
jgi:hypothetical protein